MRVLYAVTESDADAEFFALWVDKLCGWRGRLEALRIRRGRGVEPAMESLRDGLKMARAAAGSGEVAFLAALDNDRARHPENEGTLNRPRLLPKEQKRESRRDWLHAEVEAVLGPNRAAWPMPVALAVPVEMLECWLWMIFRPDPQPPRFFSRQTDAGARKYYEGEPPPQWKELCADLQKELGTRDRETFFLHAAEQLDPAALAERSLSFAEFRDMVAAWPSPAAAV